MGPGLILETTFLIAHERELTRGTPGPAHDFLAAHAAEHLYLTFITAGELAAGRSRGGGQRADWERFLAPFRVLPCTPDVCWEYGEAFRFLKGNGLLIAANDLWIASTAIAFGRPLVTANVRHFRRVPRLEVMDYTGAG